MRIDKSLTPEKLSKYRKQFQKEQQEYEKWLQGGTETIPDFVDAPIGDLEKLEAYCELTAERVLDGAVFRGKLIVEILLGLKSSNTYIIFINQIELIF